MPNIHTYDGHHFFKNYLAKPDAQFWHSGLADDMVMLGIAAQPT